MSHKERIIKKFVIAASLAILLGPFVASVHATGAPKVFKKCKACHKTNKDHTKWSIGPGLKNIGKRVSRGYLEKMLTDPQATVDAGGPEVDLLKKGAKFKSKLKMPKQAKKLSKEDVKALVQYLMTL